MLVVLTFVKATRLDRKAHLALDASTYIMSNPRLKATGFQIIAVVKRFVCLSQGISILDACTK